MAKLRSVKVHKAPLVSPFLGMDPGTIGKVVSKLKLSGIRLYLYLACNKDGFTWLLNAVSYAEWLGIPYGDGSTPRKMLRDGIEDLKKNHFLVEVEVDSKYEFFEQGQG